MFTCGTGRRGRSWCESLRDNAGYALDNVGRYGYYCAEGIAAGGDWFADWYGRSPGAALGGGMVLFGLDFAATQAFQGQYWGGDASEEQAQQPGEGTGLLGDAQQDEEEAAGSEGAGESEPAPVSCMQMVPYYTASCSYWSFVLAKGFIEVWFLSRSLKGWSLLASGNSDPSIFDNPDETYIPDLNEWEWAAMMAYFVLMRVPFDALTFAADVEDQIQDRFCPQAARGRTHTVVRAAARALGANPWTRHGITIAGCIGHNCEHMSSMMMLIDASLLQAVQWDDPWQVAGVSGGAAVLLAFFATNQFQVWMFDRREAEETLAEQAGVAVAPRGKSLRRCTAFTLKCALAVVGVILHSTPTTLAVEQAVRAVAGEEKSCFQGGRCDVLGVALAVGAFSGLGFAKTELSEAITEIDAMTLSG